MQHIWKLSDLKSDQVHLLLNNICQFSVETKLILYSRRQVHHKMNLYGAITDVKATGNKLCSQQK